MMFTSIRLLKKFRMPFADRQTMFWLLGCLENRERYAWLKKTGWRGCEYFYCYGMTQENGVTGAYLALFPKRIYLCAGTDGETPEAFFAHAGNYNAKLMCHPALRSTWGGLIADTAVHELYHRYQRLKLGAVLYALAALPGIRQLVLEPSANEYGAMAEKDIERILASVSETEYEKRMGQANHED